MKYLLLLLLSFSAHADQRFETVGGFCHFILSTQNDDNEVFFSNCQNSITQLDDGSAIGSSIIEMEYPDLMAPVTTDTYFDSFDNDVECVMVDSNGTEYRSRAWRSSYIVSYDRNTVIRYELSCLNGRQ